VGRALARLELRTVLAAFVRRYELRFAPGYAAEDWFDNLGDGFTMIRPPLRVVLSRRA
jgi:cytochrome P450